MLNLYHIETIVDNLISKKIIHSEEKSKAIESIKDSTRNHTYLVWSLEDIIVSAKQRKIKINKDEALFILNKLETNHDCSIGVTWDTINSYLEELENEI